LQSILGLLVDTTVVVPFWLTAKRKPVATTTGTSSYIMKKRSLPTTETSSYMGQN